MDLSFARFAFDGTLVDLSGDFATLMAGVSVRQAASRTAMAAAPLTPLATDNGLLNPSHGAFNRPMAATIFHWKQE